MSSALLKSKFLGSKRQVPLLTVSSEPKFRILLVNDPYDRQTFAESKGNWKFYPGLSWQRKQAVLSKYAPFIFFQPCCSPRWARAEGWIFRLYLECLFISMNLPLSVQFRDELDSLPMSTQPYRVFWLPRCWQIDSAFEIPSTRRKESILSTKRK